VLILRDLEIGKEDWDFVKAQRYPARTFQNGLTKLTIVLANKLELEKQLGADLIYVNETVGSVVFVQYKMFDGDDGEKGYRPDEQLSKEIARMDATAIALAKTSVDETCRSYRFGTEAFFLKFCTRLLAHSDEGHVPGHYIPVGYWKRLVREPRVRGRRGGVIVYPDTLGRSFTATAFTDLVARGWIGTSTFQTQALVPFIKSAMRGRKGIVLAVESIDSVDVGTDDQHRSIFKPRKPRYLGQQGKVFRL
jgi:hypothetical protein